MSHQWSGAIISTLPAKEELLTSRHGPHNIQFTKATENRERLTDTGAAMRHLQARSRALPRIRLLMWLLWLMLMGSISFTQ
jgi:hypothetical protein